MFIVFYLRILRLADDACRFKVDVLLRLELFPLLTGIPSSATDINDEAEIDFCDILEIQELVVYTLRQLNRDTHLIPESLFDVLPPFFLLLTGSSLFVLLVVGVSL